MTSSHDDEGEPVWFCDIDDEESGPFVFAELRTKAADGFLKHSDRVRKGEGPWVPARRIANLFSQQSRDNIPLRSRAPGVTSGIEKTVATARWYKKPVTQRALGMCLGGFCILLSAVVAGWWSITDEAFPHPIAVQLRAADDPRETIKTNVLRAPFPREPSIPGIRANRATPVPGLEEFVPGFSPSLSSDFKTIVFAGTGASGPGFDLYIADRSESIAAFAAPKRIASCESPETDAYCSISPNGLELLFLRTDNFWKLMYSSRPARNKDFGDPIELEIKDFDIIAANYIVSNPQFVSDNAIVVARQPRGEPLSSREFFISYRMNASLPFETPEELLIEDNSPLYAVSANGKRAYFGWPEGISFVVRGDERRPFSNSRIISSAVITGPIDGPIWVSPKEDLIFFSSPGAGSEIGDRRLWMIGYSP